jgi:hypothetical protein
MRSNFQINLRHATARKSRAFLLLFLGMSLSMSAQRIATLDVILDQSTAGVEVPVATSLDAITHDSDSMLSLYMLKGKEMIAVPFQIAVGSERQLVWLVNGEKGTLRFQLMKKPPETAKAILLTAERKDGQLTLKSGNKNLLRYQFETVMPPPGINEVYKRSGFIHPLWAPHGQILTRIQPPDHYHHYGIWNPWTHVLFEGDTVDFWNLNARQGTVRFSEILATVNGNSFAEYAAVQDHVAFRDGKEKIAIREVQTVRIYAPDKNANHYITDVTIRMNCPESPVRLLEYRYGGFGWRATEQWTKENSKVLTSEGKGRKDADGSTARWCIVEGPVDGENAGVVLMSYPANYNHPEPLRIWPENANRNRGDMFANFSPTKNMDWQLEPGHNYILKYRLVVFNGPFSKEKAEAGWHYFADPPLVRLTKE